jgi:hypothetical protein
MHDTSTAVVVWWAFLSVVSVANVIAWTRLAARPPDDGDLDLLRLGRWQVALSAVFVFGCAFRSFLPRTEAQRFCLYDSWLSDAPLARMVATLAELAFVAQVALMLDAAARAAGSRVVLVLARLLVPLIAMAELFSWYTALTTNFAGSIVEESTWAITFTLAIVAFGVLRDRLEDPVRKAATLAAVLAAGYVLFMCTVDVPMYWRRWLHDEAAGKTYLSLADGWRDSWGRRVVTRRWEDWREEMPWMSLYFSAAVWISIGMAGTPRLLQGAVRARESAVPEPGLQV